MAIKNNYQDRPLPKQQPSDLTTMPIDPDTPDDPAMKSTAVDRPKDLPTDQVIY